MSRKGRIFFLPAGGCWRRGAITKHTKVDMIWIAGRSPTLVSHSLRGVATNLKATTLTYLAIDRQETERKNWGGVAGGAGGQVHGWVLK